MFDSKVTGDRELYALRQTTKQIDVTLWPHLTRKMRTAGKPAIRAARESALETLPRRGGLAAEVARSRFTVATRTGTSTAGVYVRAVNRRSISSMNNGHFRHPVYGNREVWVGQDVAPGWFDRAMREQEGEFRDAVEDAMREFANQLEGRVSRR